MDIDDLRIELRSARLLVVALDAQRDGQCKMLDDLQEELAAERVARRHARRIASSLQQRLNQCVDNAVRLRDELAKKEADPM